MGSGEPLLEKAFGASAPDANQGLDRRGGHVGVRASKEQLELVDHLRIPRLAHRLDEELPHAVSGSFTSLGELVRPALSHHPENLYCRVPQANVVGLDKSNQKRVNQRVLLHRLRRKRDRFSSNAPILIRKRIENLG